MDTAGIVAYFFMLVAWAVLFYAWRRLAVMLYNERASHVRTLAFTQASMAMAEDIAQHELPNCDAADNIVGLLRTAIAILDVEIRAHGEQDGQ